MVERIDKLFKYAPYVLLIVTLTIVVYARIRLLGVPLERDEGEYAYMGQLLLRGLPPYLHVYTMKLPGVSALYAMIMFLFGQTAIGIHLGFLIVNGICIYFVYLLTLRLIDRNTAVLSCSVYALLSLSQSVLGLHAHATHFVLLFALPGLILLLQYLDNKRNSFIFMSGICLGLALVMKQHAIMLIFFSAVYLGWRYLSDRSFRKEAALKGSLFFAFGVSLPYLLVVMAVIYVGAFDEFFFWTVKYARQYTSALSLAEGWSGFIHAIRLITKPFLPVWFFAAVGCIIFCMRRSVVTERFFLGAFLLSSFLSMCPGLLFREHYFVLILPAVSILSGLAVNNLFLYLPSFFSGYKHMASFFLMLFALGYGVNNEKDYLFSWSPIDVSRATYGFNPFPEAIVIADYLNKHSNKDDRIAILGSEPEILFYAQRLSATGHIYMYGLMEQHSFAGQMQMQAIRQIITAQPKFIVFVSLETSWLTQPQSIVTILEWRFDYLEQNYVQIGVIDLLSQNNKYIWDADAAGYTPISGNYITVYRRK